MNNESFVGKICACLETLVYGRKSDSSPNSHNPKDENEALFHGLKKNLHFAFDLIEKYDDLKSAVKQFITICHKKKCKTCGYLKFLELSIVLFKLLNGALLAEESEQSSSENKKASASKGLLSISQQKIVKKALEFVVAIGILPNLLQGIGIPLSKRLKYAELVEHFSHDVSPRQKQAQVALCLETLLGCIERDALQSIIMPYHATDILAAFFQLCHAPIKKLEAKDDSAATCSKKSPNFDSPSTSLSSENDSSGVDATDTQEKYFLLKLSTIKDYTSYTNQQLITEMLEDRSYFTPKLEKFMKKLCSSILLWELFLFQGIPNKENWLTKICNQMLTDMILQKNGIVSFVQVILNKAYDFDVQNGNVDKTKLDAIADLIVYNRVRHITRENYVQKLSKQVLELLRIKGTQIDTILHYIASGIILRIIDRNMKTAEEDFLEPLLQPVGKCVSTTGEGEIVVKEKVLSYCIEDLHKIFVLNNSPLSRKHIKLLFPFFHCFSNMYFFLLQGVSSLKAKVKSLLVNILTNANDEDAISLLHAATFSMVNDKGILVYMTSVDFAYGEEGGIAAVKHVEDDFSELYINCHAILGLLSELKNKSLNRSFFLLILKVFCSYRNEVIKNSDDPKYERFRNFFSALIQELPQWDIDLREALMSNVSEVIDILVALLNTVIKCEDGNDDNDETIMMVTMILYTFMIGNDELSSTDWLVLKKCLPALEKLMKKPLNKHLKGMVSCIVEDMLTQGVAGRSRSDTDILQKCISELSNEAQEKEQSSSDSDETETDLSAKSAKPEPSSVADDDFLKNALAGFHIPECSDETSKLAAELEMMWKLDRELDRKTNEITSFEKAIQDIKDTSIPIKGHGFIEMGKLLSNRNRETLCYKKELLSLFQAGLENDDSYVYLSAIQCLSLLAEIDAELVLPTILKVYQNPGDKSTKFILKVGEVLLKICHSLGEHTYKYKDALLHAYLIGTKHEDPQIRSSSLSNLGEACSHLKFNIIGRLQEILMCVQSLLETDKDLEVRRCAVMVIRLLLKGMGKNILQEPKIGRDIYRNLKKVYKTETDEVLHLQSQLAMEEIDAVMKELLSIQLPLTKEIRIIH